MIVFIESCNDDIVDMDEIVDIDNNIVNVDMFDIVDTVDIADNFGNVDIFDNVVIVVDVDIVEKCRHHHYLFNN